MTVLYTRERQRIERAVAEHPIGKAFLKFEVAHANAWVRAHKEAWKKSDDARKELMDLLLPIMGIK